MTRRQYAIDTETTGLKSKEGDRIIEIGIVEITRDPNPRTYHRYFNPGDREIAADATDVHGLTNDGLADEPTFEDCIDEILEFLGDDPELIIHNAPFDLEFLRDECLEIGRVWPEYPVIDTLKESIRHHQKARHTLDALCKRYNVDASARTKHGALLDADLLAQVFLAWFGQGGLGLEAKTTAVSKEDLSALGPLNDIVVPVDLRAAAEKPPAKSWDEFFAEHAI